MISRSSAFILTALLVTASVALTKYYWPTYAIQTREHETVVTKIVTQVHTVVAKDGTQTTDTYIVDTGKSDATKTVTIPPQAQWRAGALVNTAWDGLKPTYTITSDRRILGPIFVGVSVRTDGSLGAGISFEF